MFVHEDIVKALQPECKGAVDGSVTVTTDSRSAGSGQVFLALKGERYDAHTFIPNAVDNGVAGVIVDHEMECSIPQYIVSDTLAAYQALAAYNRSRFQIPLIGVTGTNGKTTVKELVFTLLESCGTPFCSMKNFNNHVGVPASLLELGPACTHAVIEMGMNHPGEISLLTTLARPDVAVITCIGRAHLEFMKTLDAVATAKAEIFEGVHPGGTAVLPRQDAFYRQLKDAAVKRGLHVVSFGTEPGADVYFDVNSMTADMLTGIMHTPKGTTTVAVRLAGRHNAANAAAATAAAMAAEPSLSLAQIMGAFARAVPVAMRCQVRITAGIKIILDCYNANPDSSRAAIQFLADIDGEAKRCCLFGDMLELGNASAELHREIGAFIAEKGIDAVAVLGEYKSDTARGALQNGMSQSAVTVCNSRGEALNWLRKEVRAGNVLLVKGSRDMKLEQIIHIWCAEMADKENDGNTGITGTRCENRRNTLQQSPTPKPNTNSTFACYTPVMVPQSPEGP
jgi:UDP-N-acetylmuramoyl-tripeptide--D-alanyl-D-alanine ligase